MLGHTARHGYYKMPRKLLLSVIGGDFMGVLHQLLLIALYARGWLALSSAASKAHCSKYMLSCSLSCSWEVMG
jgi:hypothetical protein